MMGLFDQIDLMARGGSLALLLLWSWLLLRDHRGELAARLAVAMNVTICCYILVTARHIGSGGPIGLVLAMGAGCAAGLFWLFARAWFNDHQRVSRGGAALVLLALVNTLVLQISWPQGGAIALVTGILFRLFQIGFALAALWEVWRGRDNDLVEARRRLRMWLVTSVALYVALIAMVEIAAQNGATDLWVMRLVGSGTVLIIFAFCAAMLRLRQADLFASPPGPDAGTSRTVNPADERLSARLLDHMTTMLPHREEALSIAALAAQLGEPEYRVRRVINGTLGHRNFAAFVNGYRLAEVKAALADPSQRDVPILTIALDAGFGSLGPFNRAFRDAEGMTPSEYRAARLADS
jgi:AraC-like DNA-binding protein